MPTLNIGNQSVQVDDSFLSLSPDQQNATVDEIAGSLGGGSAPQSGNASQLNGVGAPTTPQEESSTIGDIAKSAGTGALKGALGIANLPNLAAEGIDYLSGSNLQKYTQPVEDYLQSKAAPYIHTPQTQLGGYAETAGEFAPNLIGGPESLATKLITRVAAPAIGSNYGGEAAQAIGLPESVGQVGGAVLGGAAPGVLGRAISPLNISAEKAAAADTLAGEGVTGLTAAQVSGSPAAKLAEDELGNALGAGGKANKAYNAVQQQFTQAALSKAGINATAGTPDVIDGAFTANGNEFDAIAARNPAIPIDQQSIFNEFDQIGQDYHNTTGNAPPPIFDALKQRITAAAPQGNISGAAYQKIQSDIGSLARSADDGHLKFALYNLKGTLDNSIENGLSQINNAKDAQAWASARGQYKNLLVIEKALSGTTEAANSGLITPAALTQADRYVNGMRAYVTGNSPFSALAHAGNQLLKAAPNSGTAQRTAAHLMPALFGGLVGGGIGGLAHVAAGAAAPAVLGRAVMSRPVQAYLKNQRGAALRRSMPSAKRAATLGVLGYGGSQ